MTRRLIVVSAGLSLPSSTRLLGDQIADAVRAQVAARGEEVEIADLELRELAVDLATTMSTGGLPTPAVAAAVDQVAAADGVVAVTPVFTASYSGLFKSFFDVLDPESLVGVPVVVAATAGTSRHSLVLDHAMRPLFAHLRALVMPTGVFAATDDFGGAGGADLPERIARAAAELAGAMVVGEPTVGGFSPNEHDRSRRGSALSAPTVVTPFEDLLRGHTG